MSAKRRKAARKAVRRAKVKAGRRAPRVKGVVRRKAAKPVRRASNVKRMKKREVKRVQARKRVLKTSARPRPTVRPRVKPRKVMSKKAVRRISRPRPTKSSARARSVRPTAKRIAKVASAAAAGAGISLLLNAANAHPDISVDVSSLQSDLGDIEERGSFSHLENDIAELDANLSHALSLLESARDKGYKYQSDLEDIAYEAMNSWQEVREKVVDEVERQVGIIQGDLSPLDGLVKRLNGKLSSASAASSLLQDTQAEADRVIDSIEDAERAVEKFYNDIESDASRLNSRLTTIHWMLTQQDEAGFKMGEGEDMVRAVANRWDKEGKNDPEGILFLTNQRMVFEQKEKVATKKVLFITTASELVQQVVVDQKLAEVKKVKAESKGLFGHHDFLAIEFGDKKLGKVSFHLNGQDSEEWSRLIGDAKSGKIEDDRATGSGLSFSDLTGPLTTADIMDMQNEVNELQGEVMMQEARGELGELETQTHNLTRELADLRARGYVIEKGLDADVTVLQLQWESVKARSDATIEMQTKLLSEQMRAVQEAMGKLAGMSDNLKAARPVFVQAKSGLASLGAQADAAEETILNQYDEYADEVEALSAHMAWIDWMLDAVSTASFQLSAAESGVAAVEAAWERPGMDPENGVLFLTDQRLIWEDRTGDYEVKVEAAHTQVEGVEEEEDEETGAEDLLFTFAAGGDHSNARFELAMPVAEDWLQMVGRARAGDYAVDRAVEIDEGELERIRNAPTECSNCGAAFTAPVLRGQTEITCEYCSAVTRI